jgi:hypothetical protein
MKPVPACFERAARAGWKREASPSVADLDERIPAVDPHPDDEGARSVTRHVGEQFTDDELGRTVVRVVCADALKMTHDLPACCGDAQSVGVEVEFEDT